MHAESLTHLKSPCIDFSSHSQHPPRRNRVFKTLGEKTERYANDLSEITRAASSESQQRK